MRPLQASRSKRHSAKLTE